MFVFVSYTTCNPVRRLFVFVHWAAAGKDNHCAFIRAYKRHVNTRVLTCEQRFLWCRNYTVIVGVVAIKTINLSAAMEISSMSVY